MFAFSKTFMISLIFVDKDNSLPLKSASEGAPLGVGSGVILIFVDNDNSLL